MPGSLLLHLAHGKGKAPARLVGKPYNPASIAIPQSPKNGQNPPFVGFGTGSA
jgi:hypothetical protein